MAKGWNKSQASHFKQGRTPYNPMTSEHEILVPQGVKPYCAMMQVAVEDTYDDYLICRGFDTRDKRYYDYVEGDADKKGIAVAKPYGARGISNYKVGEVYAAFLSYMQLSDSRGASQNPGKAETTVGQPEDLDEKIVELRSDDDIRINWMIVETGPGDGMVELCLAEDHPGRGVVFTAHLGVWNPDSHEWEYDDTTTTYKAIDWREGTPYPDAGSRGLFNPMPSTTHGVIYDCVSLDCDSPGAC